MLFLLSLYDAKMKICTSYHQVMFLMGLFHDANMMIINSKPSIAYMGNGDSMVCGG